MRKIRIHVDQHLAAGEPVTLPTQAATHVARVLRMDKGETLALFNGDGHDYVAELLEVGRGAVVAVVTSRHPVACESPLPLTLAQGIARGDKMDLIVQKATELGAACVVPLLSERSGVRLDAARADKRVQRWQAVAAAACEQCGRARLPRIEPPRTLADWLETLPDDGALRLSLLPRAKGGPHGLDMPDAGVLLAAGPEGGLGEGDVERLQDSGFRGLRLGPRILRTETAGLAALAALQSLYGDFR